MNRLLTLMLIFVSLAPGVAQAQAVTAETTESAAEPVIFRYPNRWLVDHRVWNMAWGDVDQDGDADVVVEHYDYDSGHQYLRLYRNEGELPYTAYQTFQVPKGEIGQILIEDINSDSYPDLIIVREGGPNSVHRNTGDGSFEGRGTMLGLNADRSAAIIAVDLDGDSDNDLVVANAGRTKRYLNDGRGGFSAGRSINREALRATDVIAGDVDKDGDIDLILGAGSGFVILFENQGGGRFDADGAVITASRLGHIGKLALADMDDDGNLDLFAADRNGLKFFRGRGDGSFEAPVDLNGESYVFVSDIDFDGDLDLVTGPIMALLNSGDGQWVPASKVNDHDNPRQVALQDVDNDGDLDLLAVRMLMSGVKVYLNQSNASSEADN